MAVDIFLKLEGIDGESKDSEHTDEIDVLAWAWGMSQSGTFHTGGGGGAGKVSIQDLSVTKYVDLASPLLMLYCSNGDHMEEAVLTVRKAGGTPLEYIVITMKKVMVTSVSTGGNSDDDRHTESVTLNFADVTVRYAKQGDTGEEEAAKEYHWDIEANEGDVS